jgi:hypothetical protein
MSAKYRPSPTRKSRHPFALPFSQKRMESMNEEERRGPVAPCHGTAVVNYALEAFEQELLRAIENRGCKTSVLDRKIADLEKKIRNCTTAIAEGHGYKSLLEQVGLLEAELEQARSEREDIRPESLRVRMRDTRRFVEINLGNLRELLSGEARMARVELAKHIRRIVLTREGKMYVAAGNWSLLGLGCYDGAGGQNRTGYARLFRAALYQ